MKIVPTFKDRRVIHQATVTAPTNGPRSPRTPFMPRFPGTPWNKYILLDILVYSIAVYSYELCGRIFTSHRQRILIYSDATHESTD